MTNQEMYNELDPVLSTPVRLAIVSARSEVAAGWPAEFEALKRRTVTKP